MTAHWICRETLHRKSANIALKRIIGRHTSEALTNMIQDILIDYNITSKIVKIVTDNAANFVKAMKETEEETSMDETGIEFISLTKILRNATHINNIPLHQRCAAHTLNLCMTSDILNALKKALKQVDTVEQQQADSEDEIEFDEDLDLDVTLIDSAINYRNVSDSTFKKTKDLWNRQSRSTLSADVIKKVLGVYLITPNETRWNSLLDSLTQLLSFIKTRPAELKDMFKQLKLDYFTTEEINFIKHYVSVS